MKPSEVDANVLQPIDQYIDRICKRMSEPQRVIADFREEMTSNLYSSALELMEAGHSGEQAVKIAIERFGEFDVFEQELRERYRINSIFSKGILKSALILFILGAIILSWFPIWNEVLSFRAPEEAFVIIRENMGTVDQPVTEVMQKQLQMLVDRNKGLTGVVLHTRDKEDEQTSAQVKYSYPANQRVDELGNISFQENTFTYTSIIGTQYTFPGTNHIVDIEMGMKHINNTVFTIGMSLLFGYWLLFTVWASMNAYYNKRGSIVWPIVFMLFNIIGYGIYRLSYFRKTLGQV